MGRPPTRPVKLKDGYYIEVRNKGSHTAIKIRRDTENEMHQAARSYQMNKEVVILGQLKGGKWLNDKKK